MPRLSLGLGVQNVRKVKAGAAAAPLVVATTNAVNISGSNLSVPDGTYTKVTTVLARVAGSLTSDKLLLATGLVYLNQAGFTDSSGTVNPFYSFVPYGYILIPPNTTFTATGYTQLDSDTTWKAGVVYGDGDASQFIYDRYSLNSSTDANYIPTSGWSPSITITAA